MFTKRRLVLLISFILTGCLILFWLYFSTADKEFSDSTFPTNKTNTSHKNQNAFSTSDSVRTPEAQELSYQYCKVLKSKRREFSREWFADNYESWGSFIGEQHSLDDVTMAIEYFSNSNFAARFRVTQLRKDSIYTRDISALNEAAWSIVPEFFELKGASLTKKVPSFEITEYTALPDESKQRFLKESGLSVDDIAYFIYQTKTPDSVINELIDYVPNLNEIVSYGYLEATSLLDYAIISTRPEVVKALLEREINPTKDVYLGSSMDWALSRLTYFLYGPDREREQAAEIVEVLLDEEAPTKLIELEDNKVSGRFPRKFYEFDEEHIQILLNEFNIDLQSLVKQEKLSVDPASATIAMLKESRIRHINTALNIDDLDDKLSICEAKINSIHEKWKPQRSARLVNKAVDKFLGDEYQIETYLAALDPLLIDYYRETYKTYRRHEVIVPNSDSLFNTLDDGNVDEVLDDFNKLPLTDENRNWVFSQVIGFNTDYYTPLVEAGYLVDEIEYAQFRRHGLLTPNALVSLNNAGVDTFDTDSMGKTLFYYAVKIGNIEMVSHMINEGYFSVPTDGGEDPLHALLNPNHHTFSDTYVETLLPLLMKSNPRVDQFHLSRMALIELKYPALYQRLVVNYPQLRVSQNTPIFSFL